MSISLLLGPLLLADEELLEQAGVVWFVEELCKAPKGNGGTAEAAAAAIRFRLESMAFMATKAGDMQPKEMCSSSEYIDKNLETKIQQTNSP